MQEGYSIVYEGGYMDLDLKGTILLDDETMSKLKSKIREEIKEEIKKNGHYYSEIKEFLIDCEFKEYYKLIRLTIDKVIDKIDEDDLNFTDEIMKMRTLKLIRDFINVIERGNH